MVSFGLSNNLKFIRPGEIQSATSSWPCSSVPMGMVKKTSMEASFLLFYSSSNVLKAKASYRMGRKICGMGLAMGSQHPVSLSLKVHPKT